MSAHDDPLKTIILQAMEAGAIRSDDVDIAAYQLTAMVKELFHAPVVFLGEPYKLDKSRSDVIADCVDMFLGHYRK